MTGAEFRRAGGRWSADSMVGICRASRELGIGEQWLRQAVAAGEIPAYRFNVQVRLRVTDIRNWLATRRVR